MLLPSLEAALCEDDEELDVAINIEDKQKFNFTVQHKFHKKIALKILYYFYYLLANPNQ